MKAAVVLSFLATAALAEPPPPLSDADFPSISSAEVELGQFDVGPHHLVDLADVLVVRADHFEMFANERGVDHGIVSGHQRGAPPWPTNGYSPQAVARRPPFLFSPVSGLLKVSA